MAVSSNGSSQSATPLLAGLEDGAVVMLAPSDRRILSMKGVPLRRPRIGVRLRYRREGDITFREGRIAAGDLMCDGYDRAFERRVAPGNYSVVTVYAETARDTVAAFGVIRFVDAMAEKCTLALFEGEDPSELTDDMGGGLGTDSGTIAIGEPEGDRVDVSDEEVAAFRRRIDLGFGDNAGSQLVTEPRGGAVCVWRPSYGDRMYTPYWGIGRDVEPCFLAVDFGVVANGLRAPAIGWRSVGESLANEPESWWRRLWTR